MSPFVVLRSLVLLTVIAMPVHATVFTTGDVDPGWPGTQPDPWEVGGLLHVGRSNDGTLNVTVGGLVSNTSSNIGLSPGSTGEVTVKGSGSQWNNSYNCLWATKAPGR